MHRLPSVFLKFVVFGLLCLGVAVAQAARRPDTPPRTSPSFSEVDKNGDGKISLDEFKAAFPNEPNPEAKFKSLDTNGDGSLSMDEYKAGYPDPVKVKKAGKSNKGQAKKSAAAARTSPTFAQVDTNSDGKITLDEFKAAFPNEANPEAKFKSLDTNGDGSLSIDEYKAGYPDPVPPPKRSRRGQGQ